MAPRLLAPQRGGHVGNVVTDEVVKDHRHSQQERDEEECGEKVSHSFSPDLSTKRASLYFGPRRLENI
jgi:hypothetical protein